MRTLRPLVRWLPLVVLWLGLASSSSRADDKVEFVVIMHPDSGVTEVSRDTLRDAYLKKATEWRNGETMRPIDLSNQFSERERFTREVLRKSPSQLRTYWNQQIFSGKGAPPPEAVPADVIAYVLAHPGGVGYIPTNVDPGAAKVVKVK